MAETTTPQAAGEGTAAIPEQAGAAPTEQTTRIAPRPALEAAPRAETAPAPANAAPGSTAPANTAPEITAPEASEGTEAETAAADNTAETTEDGAALPSVPSIADEPPRVIAGFEELTHAWWSAVLRVHQVLLEDADIETVGGAFNAELYARWEYARTLHERGFQVPDYLAEKAPVAPLWPQPQPPLHLSQLARVA